MSEIKQKENRFIIIKNCGVCDGDAHLLYLYHVGTKGIEKAHSWMCLGCATKYYPKVKVTPY